MSDNSIFEMDDSDFSNKSLEEFLTEAQDESQEDSQEVLDNDDESELDSDTEEHGSDFEEEGSDDDEFEEDGESDDELDSEESEEDGEDESDEDDSEADAEDDSSDANDNPDLEKLFTPFKAAGQEFKIESVDEALRLAKMGLDYNRKMVALKPHRQLLKLLDNNDMLDQEKLNFAIDLMSGNKAAITKLVSDHKLDVMDINTEEDNDYTPSNRQVAPTAVDLDDVIDSLRSTDTFADTMQTVTKDWDEASKREIVAEPQYLTLINTHKANGVFAKVEARMQRERMFGGLTGLSDFEAYRAAGDLIFNEGGFNTEETQQKSEPHKKVVSKKPKVDTELNNKRKKASQASGKKRQPKKAITSYDIVEMDDEAFANFKPF